MQLNRAVSWRDSGDTFADIRAELSARKCDDYLGNQIGYLVPSTTRPPLRSMKSSAYAVFAFGATSKVSKKCPRFLEPVVRLFASLSTESVSTFLNQCE